MTMITTTIRDRRIDAPAPSDIPDDTEITLTIAERDENAPLPPDEIARILSAMQQLPSWDLPEDVAADLDAWEKRINQHGIVRRDESMESVFR
jgi:hypothetical protein